MYPCRDFRSLIQSDQPEQAIKAISREPFPELLKYWTEHHQEEYLKLEPEDHESQSYQIYQIYYIGIQEATGKERYPCFLLDLIKDYPEFYGAVRDGLFQLWCQLRFSFVENTQNSQSKNSEEQSHDKCSQSKCYQSGRKIKKWSYLYIESIKGQDVYISDQNKIDLVELLRKGNKIPLYIKQSYQTVKVKPSSRANQIHQKLCWLQKSMYKSK